MAHAPKKRSSATFTQALAWGLILLLTSSFADSKKAKPATDTPDAAGKFKVAVDLVSVNATVTDKKGNPITQLTQNDFQVLEEGAPQTITVFRVQAAPGAVVAGSTPEGSTSATDGVHLLSRKVILFVDDYHLDFETLSRLKKAGETFIQTGLAPTDMVALITASGKNSTEFTKYREYVVASLKNVFPIETLHHQNMNCPPLTDYQAYLISAQEEHAGDAFDVAVNDTIHCASLESIPNAADIAANMVKSTARMRGSEITEDSRRTLYALQALARRLRAIEGQKVLVLLSGGLLTHEIITQLQDAIDAAIRANTLIYSIDAAGLVATPPGGDASSSLPVSPQAATVRPRLETEERLAKEDALNALAADTGGVFLKNSNDLLGQMKSAVNRTRVSYLLGYYSTNTKRDGSFRKIAVKVNQPGLVVSARKGYFAPKGEAGFEMAKNEDIQEALRNAEDMKEIPVTVGYNVTHPDSTHTLLAIQTRIDVRKIHFQKRENRNRNIFTIVTVVYDSNDRYIEGKETRIDFNLTDPSYKNVMEEGLLAQASFRLEPGNYRLKTVVREAGETKLGSATKTIEIMN
jgi:VWFA-related protein